MTPTRLLLLASLAGVTTILLGGLYLAELRHEAGEDPSGIEPARAEQRHEAPTDVEPAPSPRSTQRQLALGALDFASVDALRSYPAPGPHWELFDPQLLGDSSITFAVHALEHQSYGSTAFLYSLAPRSGSGLAGPLRLAEDSHLVDDEGTRYSLLEALELMQAQSLAIGSASFPPISQSASRARLVVPALVTSDGTRVPGPWELDLLVNNEPVPAEVSVGVSQQAIPQSVMTHSLASDALTTFAVAETVDLLPIEAGALSSHRSASGELEAPGDRAVFATPALSEERQIWETSLLEGFGLRVEGGPIPRPLALVGYFVPASGRYRVLRLEPAD